MTKPSIIQKLHGAFAELNVPMELIDDYLGHPSTDLSPRELKELRIIYSQVRDAQARVVKGLFDLYKRNRPKHKTLSAAEAAIADKPPTIQESLEMFLDASGVNWEGLRRFLIDEQLYPAADSITTIHELPREVCEKIGTDAKAMSKLVKLFGNPNKDSVTP